MNAHKRKKMLILARLMGEKTLAPQKVELKEEVLPAVVAAVEETKPEVIAVAEETVVESVKEIVPSEPVVEPVAEEPVSVEKPVSKKKKSL